MFCISIRPSCYAGEFTVLNEHGNRTAFGEGAHPDDIRWKLKNHFPQNLFDSEEEAIAAKKSARDIISRSDYAESIKRNYYFRYGDNSDENIKEYITNLLARVDASSVIHIDSVGVYQ